jgi:UDP-N-acetylglucosamine acyltransferase
MIGANVEIHPTAIVHPDAKIGAGCSVGPYSIIGPRVTLGDNNWVGPHVVIEGITSFGSGNKVFQFASIGSVPQDLKYKGEESTVEIGDNNTFREYVTVQPGTAGGGMVTRVGSKNLLMANSHVGHDTILGDRNIIANSVGLSGHVILGSGITIGGLSGIHQFVRLGDLAFIAGGAMVTQDVPPFCTVHGDRAQLAGLNEVGLSRNGFSEEDVRVVRKIYRGLFHQKGLMKERIAKVRSEYGESKGCSLLVEFVEKSERGICRARSKGATED